MKKAPGSEAVRLRLADLCSRSEQCESDLRRKALNAGLSASEAEEIVDFLRREKFVDDARFARAYAVDKVRFSSWGKNKIRVGLMAKRIDSPLIESALADIPASDYIDALKRAGNAKARALDMSLREDRARFYRHMLSRGFESPLVVRMLDYISKNR